MGWLWSSSTNDDETRKDGITEPQSAKKLDFSLTEHQRQRAFGRPGPPQTADQSRDAQANKELEAFLSTLSAGSDAATTTPTRTTSVEPRPQDRTDHDRIRPDGSLNISPHALYPRTMSCRQAFDQGFYCYSLGGKFMDVYRFGSVQPCEEQWGDFWFCMRTRTLPAKERERRIVDHYAEKDEKRKKQFGNSERIWEMRERAVERAFWKDPDVEPDEERMAMKE